MVLEREGPCEAGNHKKKLHLINKCREYNGLAGESKGRRKSRDWSVLKVPRPRHYFYLVWRDQRALMFPLASVVGGWKMVVGGWKLVVGGWKMVVGGWKMVVGGWKLVVGGWKMVVGGCGSTSLQLRSEDE